MRESSIARKPILCLLAAEVKRFLVNLLQNAELAGYVQGHGVNYQAYRRSFVGEACRPMFVHNSVRQPNTGRLASRRSVASSAAANDLLECRE